MLQALVSALMPLGLSSPSFNRTPSAIFLKTAFELPEYAPSPHLKLVIFPPKSLTMCG